MTNEAMLDNRIKQIVDFGHASDLQLKKACLGAETVVGTYSGITGEIAKRTRRSVSSVENWAHAARLYKEYRKINSMLARSLWRTLPASHWWLAYDIHQKGYNAFFYLAKAYSHKWSGREMLAEFKVDLEAGNAKLQISRAVIAFRGLADELLKSNSLTDEQIDALMVVIDVFRDPPATAGSRDAGGDRKD